MNLGLFGCFYPPITETTTAPGAASTTPGAAVEGAVAPMRAAVPLGGTTITTPGTTTTLPPTTTTMNYCVEEKGMNNPLNITSNQVTTTPQLDQTQLADINPTTTTSGLDFPISNPQINVKLDQPATLTVIYIPIDRPNQPSNVLQFTVTFVYPNKTTSPPINSTIGVPSETTTTPSSVSVGTSTTPIPSAIFAPSAASPQVDLQPNFRVPANTTVQITITSTIRQLDAQNVRNYFVSSCVVPTDRKFHC